MSAGPKAFFNPRLAHHKPEYLAIPTRPGSPVADWRSPNPRTTTKLRHTLLRNLWSSTFSPLGLSKLPQELLEPIFDDLCGREIMAVRLVCKEWEVASRAFFHAGSFHGPFFAERYPPGHHVLVPLWDQSLQVRLPHDRCLFVRLEQPLPSPLRRL